MVTPASIHFSRTARRIASSASASCTLVFTPMASPGESVATSATTSPCSEAARTRSPPGDRPTAVQVAPEPLRAEPVDARVDLVGSAVAIVLDGVGDAAQRSP